MAKPRRRVIYGLTVEERPDGVWEWGHYGDLFNWTPLGFIHLKCGPDGMHAVASAPRLEYAVMWSIGFADGRQAREEMERRGADANGAGTS